jgi:hypothetical protein
MRLKIQTGLCEVNYRLISFDKTTELQMDSYNVAATLKGGGSGCLSYSEPRESMRIHLALVFVLGHDTYMAHLNNKNNNNHSIAIATTLCPCNSNNVSINRHSHYSSRQHNNDGNSSSSSRKYNYYVILRTIIWNKVIITTYLSKTYSTMKHNSNKSDTYKRNTHWKWHTNYSQQHTDHQYNRHQQ